MRALFLLLLLLLTSEAFCRRPLRAPLENFSTASSSSKEKSPYFLVISVDAKRLDYSNGLSCLRSIAKHPHSLDKSGSIGHAWIYLKGPSFSIEGGHSGELGLLQPRYLEGFAELIEKGDPDPIRYLFAAQKDGFFQRGSGGHQPSFAAKFELTREQHEAILHYIKSYPYRDYSLTKRQCCTFVRGIAELMGLSWKIRVEIPISPWLPLRAGQLKLWSDPKYSRLSLEAPELLEQELVRAVREGRAELALSFSKRRCLRSLSEEAGLLFDRLKKLPGRLKKLYFLSPKMRLRPLSTEPM